ncbi:MAG: hypothetical protein IJU23_15155 [Proteobacteria bacterium]|nr:hypothetical protein [Pseudomonadota bacterium]
MYIKILVANRADCAVRLIRACRREGIKTVLISARDDVTAAHDIADDVIFTGLSREAYEAQDNILEAARYTGCEAILPGWGFLSEDYAFARRCRLMGLHFIGPATDQLQIFGDKLKTIQLFSGVSEFDGHSVIDCAHGDELDRVAQTNPPWMLKNRFSGGGRNIARIDSLDALITRLDELRNARELWQYYIEPAISNARHIEFQFFGDGCGNVEFLGARDCTLQKNHQKWFEISCDLSDHPDWAKLAEVTRQKLSEMKLKTWCTVEFLMDRGGGSHFLEVNPRLQVEHGVTEMTCGVDLVRSAIATSCAGQMQIVKNDAPTFAEAAEFRLMARGTGRITEIGFAGQAWPPPDAPDRRVETAVKAGDIVSGVYDGMLARCILGGQKYKTRDNMRDWLKTFSVDGIENNINDLNHIND